MTPLPHEPPISALCADPSQTPAYPSGILLVTDDLRRGERLARDLGWRPVDRVHDLYDNPAPTIRANLVLGDVKVLTSAAILRLRPLLHGPDGRATLLLLLLHDGGPRTAAQARILGATRTLAATSSSTTIIDALAALGGGAVRPAPLAARQWADAGLRFLREDFFAAGPPKPEHVAQGTRLVTQAVKEAGIRDWVLAVRQFDSLTHGHILLVSGLAAAFAESLGLNLSDRHRLTQAALLHDVGKTRIPLAILNKPGPLTEEEKVVVRSHAIKGHALLSAGGYDDLMLAVARSHHEMLDGSGYPDGLRGDAIPDLVRLVTICDIYAALIEHRPYKPQLSPAEAMAVLAGMSGRLDSDLARAFAPVAAAFDRPAVVPLIHTSHSLGYTVGGLEQSSPRGASAR